MRGLLRTAVLFAAFLAVAGTSGYLTLRFIVKSEDTVVVPQLVGKDVVYALDILTDLGLNIKVSGFEYRSDLPKNQVAHQDPRPGSEIKKDRDVRIIISKGPKTLVMPNLVGLDIRQAHIIMEENGLAQGVVSRTFSDRFGPEELIAQGPPPGVLSTRGDAVDLLVSLGKRSSTYQMPYLHGLTIEDAILILDRSNLGLGHIRSVQRNELPRDVVVEQDPPSGYQVAAGALVNLTLNRTDEGPILDQGLSLFHHRVHEGFLKRHVRFRVNAFGVSYDLYNVFVSPGERIWFLTPQDPEMTVFLYEDGELVLGRSSTPGSHGESPVNLN